MAENAGRENTVRRSSFRRSLAEAGLPQEYLDQLEQKRKQLDESIHKYIASKEREYRFFEKDLRTQHRAQEQADASSARRRASAEEAQQATDKSPLSAVDTLLRKGSRRDSDNNAVEEDARSASAPAAANSNDRRASDDRQEFVGVFTPQYLPALDTSEDEKVRRLARAESAPEMAADKDSQSAKDAMKRANSDTAVLAPQATAKRPAHLQLSHRTSSSGSSVDGKLISAMKSSTDYPRPKRKRVSLAVGDSIVAPSDNVPLVKSNNSTPSHSRTRSTPPSSQGSSPNSSSPVREMPQQFVLTTNLGKPNTSNGSAPSGLKALHEQHATNAQAQQTAHAATSAPRGDDIGDFWHMEEPDDEGTEKFPAFDMDDEFEEDIGTGIGGRVSHTPSPKVSEPASVADEDDLYTAAPSLEPESETENEHLEFRPESVNASQQPTDPGFRRPSVIRDPGYTGRDYMRAATSAEETGIYGSSYVRPVSKGSFTAGSLGESYMARHAEEMMRLRTAKQDAKAQ